MLLKIVSAERHHMCDGTTLYLEGGMCAVQRPDVADVIVANKDEARRLLSEGVNICAHHWSTGAIHIQSRRKDAQGTHLYRSLPERLSRAVSPILQDSEAAVDDALETALVELWNVSRLQVVALRTAKTHGGAVGLAAVLLDGFEVGRLRAPLSASGDAVRNCPRIESARGCVLTLDDGDTINTPRLAAIAKWDALEAAVVGGVDCWPHELDEAWVTLLPWQVGPDAFEVLIVGVGADAMKAWGIGSTFKSPWSTTWPVLTREVVRITRADCVGGLSVHVAVNERGNVVMTLPTGASTTSTRMAK